MDMEQFVQNLQREAKKMFESDDFAHQRQAMVEQLQKKQQEMMEALMEQANRAGFALRMTPSGIMLLPTKDGKPMQEAEYLALASTPERKTVGRRRSEIEKQVEDTLRDGKKLEREIADKAGGPWRPKLRIIWCVTPMTELKEKYQDYPRVVAYLDGVHEHILKNLQRFKGADDAGGNADGDAISSANRRAIRFSLTGSTFLSTTAIPRGRRLWSKPTRLTITCSA